VRRQLPMTEVLKPYQFDTERGQETLNDLFKGRSQLIVYHFMFGADWNEGCKSCSFWMDNFNSIDCHLAARDTSFIAISAAPLTTLKPYKKRMGWSFDWVSSGQCDFNQDFGVSFIDQQAGPSKGYNYSGNVFGEEMPGVSVFFKWNKNTIAYSYSTYSRGLDILNSAYHLLDLTPQGRDEDNLVYPMDWLRRRDQY